MDIYDYQIIGNLEKMASTQLLSLSSSHTTSTEEFIARTKSFSQEQGMLLQQCSQRIECSLQELLALLKDHANLSPPQPNRASVLRSWIFYCLLNFLDDLEHFTTECEELFILFQHRNIEAVLSAVKGSVDSLRKRVTTRYIYM